MNEQEIKDEFEKIWEKIKDIEKRISDNGPQQGSQINKDDNKNKSVSEFLREINPSNDVRKTTAISYYLEKFGNKKIFSNKEIIGCFKKAKIKLPLNVPDKIQKAIQNGWLDCKERNQYSLTSSGEMAVKNKFSNSKK